MQDIEISSQQTWRKGTLLMSYLTFFDLKYKISCEFWVDIVQALPAPTSASHISAKSWCIFMKLSVGKKT